MFADGHSSSDVREQHERVQEDLAPGLVLALARPAASGRRRPRSRRWNRIASAQKCGGVHTKMIANRIHAGAASEPVTAAQPTSAGTAPAAPPITMFCVVVRFSHIV